MSGNDAEKSGFAGALHNSQMVPSKEDGMVDTAAIQNDLAQKKFRQRLFRENRIRAETAHHNPSVDHLKKRKNDRISYASKKDTSAIVAIIILVIILTVIAAGTAVLLGGALPVVVTTYPGKDADIRGADAYYSSLERALDSQISRMAQTHPGYDEYNYQVDEISHNPFHLTSLLSAKYGSYYAAEMHGILSEILNIQYTLRLRERVEIRQRPVTDPETGEVRMEDYEVRILDISLKNHGMDYVAQRYLTENQKRRYDVYNRTLGNRKGLFDGGSAAAATAPQAGNSTPSFAGIPPAALSDAKFRNMITEAEKYLGMPYVWGGSSPETSFDCSGFVSWVINHCGNGWSVGRQTAEGLRRLCTPVSRADAKPGDLIFFQGTYSTDGASHVGIYVGNNRMIHCGSPIQYADLGTQYWELHYFQMGRLP